MRLFIAIKIDPDKELIGILSELRSLGKAVEEENIHLTLKFLGEVSDDMEIIESLGKIRFNKFTMELRGIGAFPNMKRGRILFVKAEPTDILNKLSGEVDRATPNIKRDHPFIPHITLLRSKLLLDFSRIGNRIGDNLILSEEVDHFSLYQSTLTPSGPIYKEMKSFQLI